ncbi:MAG: response regulator, partial [Candidatus Adiutrix sp.]
GFNDEPDILRASGYKFIITKPLKLSELKGAIEGESFAPPTEILPPNKAPSEAMGPQPRQMRLLLVEDSLVNQVVAMGFLKRLGYPCELAQNGLEAISCLSRTNYDLVFMDCQMPEMDGYEATTFIRSGKSGALNTLVPIVAMTAHAMSGDREKCLSVGMDDYISKPINPKKLQEILDKWLK